ncbi:MAG: hypothetical protein KDC46_14900 [Thermoleophilia bacterium]|nr:hypothetical protein [Thermoleophilia bacterium]
MTVPSATQLDITACTPDTPGVTSFGNVLPGSSTVTSSDCTVTFGSSNDTSQLRLSQTDGGHVAAMHGLPTGTLDLSFNTTGSTTIAPDGFELAPYPGGGFVGIGEQNGGSGWEFGASRITESGSTSWNAYRPITGSGDSMPYDVAIDAAGKIVLAGHSGVGNPDFTVMRLNSDGSLDTTFNAAGTPGWTVAAAGPNEQDFKGVDIQSDGGIVAAGYDETDGWGKVYRFTDSGDIDTSFGTGGFLKLDQLAGSSETKPHDVTVLPDDSILVSGIVYEAFGFDVFVVKLTPDGAIDTSWGASGWRTLYAHLAVDEFLDDPMQVSYDAARDRAWIVASTEPSDIDTLVGLLDVDAGDWVNGFGTAGRLEYDVAPGADDYGSGIAAAADGSAYVLSFDDSTNKISIRHVDADGTFDTSFGTSGTWTQPSATTDYQYRGKLMMDRDGRLVALADQTIYRFETQTIPDYASGTADWSSAGGGFGACLRSVGGGGGTDGTTWAVDGGADCLATNGDTWMPIVADASTAGSKVARRTTPGTATASLRFGLRAPDFATPGTYVAPIQFDVLAPDAP